MRTLSRHLSAVLRQCATRSPHRPFRIAAVMAGVLVCVAPAFAATSYTMVDLSPITVDAATATSYQSGFVPSPPAAVLSLGAKGEVLGTAWVGASGLYSANAPTATQLYDPATNTWTVFPTTTAAGTFSASSIMNGRAQIAGSLTDAGGVLRPYVRNPDGTGYAVPYPVAALGDGGWAAMTSSTAAGNVGCNGLNLTALVGDVEHGGATTAVGSLSTEAGFDVTIARGINKTGQVVGSSRLTRGACLASSAPAPMHAFITSPGRTIVDLHTAAMPLNHSYASAINDAGTAVGAFGVRYGMGGRAGVPVIYHAAWWNSATGVYVDLGSATNPKTSSGLKAVNASGVAVGQEITYSGVMVYNWIEGTLAGSDHALIGDASGLQKLDNLTTLPAGWRLNDAMAINDAGQILARAYDSQNISHIVLLKPSQGLPAGPSNLTTQAASSARIDLTWTDNAANETGQSIEFCAGAACSNFVPVASVGANVTAFSHTGLSASTSYSYRVRAQGATGNSAYSNTSTAVTSAPVNAGPPAAPSALNAVATSSSRVSLSWTDNATNETGFTVQRCKGAGCTGFQSVAFLGVNATVFQDSGLRRRTSYTYRVRANGSAGNSTYSAGVTVLMP